MAIAEKKLCGSAPDADYASFSQKSSRTMGLSSVNSSIA
jgi:hypothetical protein